MIGDVLDGDGFKNIVFVFVCFGFSWYGERGRGGVWFSLEFGGYVSVVNVMFWMFFLVM